MCRTQVKFDDLPVSSGETPGMARFAGVTVSRMLSRVRFAVPLFGLL